MIGDFEQFRDGASAQKGVLQALDKKKILNKTVTIPSLNWMRLYEYNSKDFSSKRNKQTRSAKVLPRTTK